MNNSSEGLENKDKVLEVPYAFGKLNVTEMFEPGTNKPSGVFNVTDKERGFSFGVLKINKEESTFQMLTPSGYVTHDNVNILVDESLNAENFRKINLNDQVVGASTSGTGPRSLECSEEPKDQVEAPRFKISNMLKQKKENDYLVSPPIDKPKTKSKIEITKIVRTPPTLPGAPCTSNTTGRTSSGNTLNYKKQKATSDATEPKYLKKLKSTGDLHNFKLHIENLNLSHMPQLHWASLNFFSGKELIYTHFLYSSDALINQDTLKDIKTPVKFSTTGQFTVESLVDDFRLCLADGFTLSKNPENQTIQFRSNAPKNSKLAYNRYKLFIEPGKEIVVDSAKTQCIFDEKVFQSLLNQEVTSMLSAIKFVKYLNIAIVLHSKFMDSMGIRLDRIKREDVTSMPYYMVLKLNTGYDCLNSYTGKLLNKYLTKKNSLFSQVYNVDPKLNLK